MPEDIPKPHRTTADGLPDFWKGKRILIASHEAWGPVRLSKHHYATELVRHGAEVFFLGPDQLQMTLPAIAQRQGPQEPVLVFRKKPFPGIRFLPRPARAWLEARQLATLALACGGPFDLLWNFDLFRFRSLTDRAHARMRVVHAMDLRRPRDLQGPGAHADLVITVSPGMALAMGSSSEDVLVLPHAWMPRETPQPLPAPLPAGIKVAYMGNLAMKAIDWDAIIAMATAHPEAWFYLMGPLHGAFGDNSRLEPAVEERLRALANIHFTGPVPYDHVPAWLADMDILLIAYQLERVGLKATSSHKLMEYLASGKVVVSSYLEDHAELKDLVVMAPPGDGIANIFAHVLGNLQVCNAAHLQTERRSHAAAATYARRLAHVADQLRLRPRA
jgi:glycosyltransferase involved in cell wall biosynthesis